MQHRVKRLIETDLPIRRLSALRSRRPAGDDVDVRTPGIWWSRKPQNQCRAVLLATVLPDPTDASCPDPSKAAIRAALSQCQLLSSRGLKEDRALLDDMSTACELLADPQFATSQTGSRLFDRLSLAAQATTLTLLDPFSGGGSIPLEAARLGLNTVAGEYNPLAARHLRYLLESPRLQDELVVEAEQLLTSVIDDVQRRVKIWHPEHSTLGSPVGYIHVRVVQCEGPGCGCRVPATSKFLLDARANVGLVFASALTLGQEIAVRLERGRGSVFPAPTVKGGAITCPACHFTTTRPRVMRQGHAMKFATMVVASLYSVAGEDQLGEQPESLQAAIRTSSEALRGPLFRFVPLAKWPTTEMRRFSPPLYGLTTYSDCHAERQKAFLAELCRSLHQVSERSRNPLVRSLSELLVAKAVEDNTSFCRWRSDRGGSVEGTFAGKSIGMIWDFFEKNPVHPRNSLAPFLARLIAGLRIARTTLRGTSTVVQGPAQEMPLPDESVDVLYTDPPYWDSIPYSHLSDWPLVWIDAMRSDRDESSTTGGLSPKGREIVVDRPHSRSTSVHNDAYFREQMQLALSECCRVLKNDGIGVVVFAHLKTLAWESLLEALLAAGMTVSASWPIETERGGRLQAQNTASLQSSVHLIVRKRTGNEVGDWREVLEALPNRIKRWMHTLASEHIIGADAIFACLGPALEIFSRYKIVEKASGEPVPLKEYLTYVWGAVAQEALAQIFKGADATGFEEDARLTAMWLWTLNAGGVSHPSELVAEVEDASAEMDASDENEDEGGSGGKAKGGGYILEYDAARKIAQGLGAHLEQMSDVVEVKGDKARLLSVGERTRKLFGKDDTEAPKAKVKTKTKQMSLGFMQEIEAAEAEGNWGDKSVPKLGDTVLDRIHQSMILFAAGRGEALRRFLVEDGAGQDQRFWKLANALSALYPQGTDEKRWVDGVLARKKGLGL